MLVHPLEQTLSISFLNQICWLISTHPLFQPYQDCSFLTAECLNWEGRLYIYFIQVLWVIGYWKLNKRIVCDYSQQRKWVKNNVKTNTAYSLPNLLSKFSTCETLKRYCKMPTWILKGSSPATPLVFLFIQLFEYLISSLFVSIRQFFLFFLNSTVKYGIYIYNIEKWDRMIYCSMGKSKNASFKKRRIFNLYQATLSVSSSSFLILSSSASFSICSSSSSFSL